MVGLKKKNRSHTQKSHPKSGEPQRYSWGTQKKKKKKEKKSPKQARKADVLTVLTPCVAPIRCGKRFLTSCERHHRLGFFGSRHGKKIKVNTEVCHRNGNLSVSMKQVWSEVYATVDSKVDNMAVP